jgi:hypothetical protein
VSTLNKSVPIPNYIFASTKPRRVDRIATKIRSFAALPKGWHYGEGGPISARVINASLMWYDFLIDAGVDRIGATPSEDGAVVVSAHIRGRYTEIISENDKTFTVIRDKENGRSIHKRNMTENQAKDLIDQILGRTWNTSAGSTPASLILILSDSAAKHFAIPLDAVAQDFRSRIVDVSMRVALPYASTR